MSRRSALEAEVLDPTVELEQLPNGGYLADTIVMPLGDDEHALHHRSGEEDDPDGSGMP